MRKQHIFIGTLVAGSLSLAIAAPTLASSGPTSNQPPVLVPVADGVKFQSLLTVGDKTTTSGYSMVGIPDGMGSFSSGNYVTVFANHELRDTAGVARAHGQAGAFVSKFLLDPKTGEMRTGEDLITKVNYWQYDAKGGSYASTPSGSFKAAFSRFCSANLATKTSLFNESTGNGYKGRLFLTGEENGTESRLLAVEETGTAWQIPRAGLFSWENAPIANTGTDTTVLMGNPDATPGYLRMYKGTKTSAGTSIDRAGFTNGQLYVLAANGVADDGVFRTANVKGKSVDVTFVKSDWNKKGSEQDAEAKANGGLAFTRVEDGAFDPKNPNDYYFLTTENLDKSKIVEGALWRLRFKDVTQPERGASLTVLMDGTEDLDPATAGVQGWQKPDNMDIDRHGNLVLQEDPGDADYVAGIVAYQIETGKAVKLAMFDPEKFAPGGKNFITRDEESSGIHDTEALLGKGTFLLNAQVHSTEGVSKEAVEQGQILRLTVDWSKAYAKAIQATPKA